MLLVIFLLDEILALVGSHLLRAKPNFSHLCVRIQLHLSLWCESSLI